MGCNGEVRAPTVLEKREQWGGGALVWGWRLECELSAGRGCWGVVGGPGGKEGERSSGRSWMSGLEVAWGYLGGEQRGCERAGSSGDVKDLVPAGWGWGG